MPLLLSLREASEYSGIGINRLREITDRKGCGFVLFVGNRRMIKRKGLEKFIDESEYI